MQRWRTFVEIKRKPNKRSPPGGLEPPTFRLTAERANHCATETLAENRIEIFKNLTITSPKGVKINIKTWTKNLVTIYGVEG